MKKALVWIVMLMLLVVPTMAVWTPPSDIDMRNVYDIFNVTNMNATNFYQNGTRLVSESELGNASVNYSTYSNSSVFWAGANAIQSLWFYIANNIFTFNESYNNITIASIAAATPPNTNDSWIISDSEGLALNTTTGDSRYYTQVLANSTFILQSEEANLNVNSSNYWDSLGTPADITLLGTQTQNLNMGGLNITNAIAYKFNISGCEDSTTEGTVCWNPDDMTLNVVTGLGNVVQVGYELSVIAINKEGSTIYNGQIVYITGGQGDRPTIALADASDANKAYVEGIVTKTSCASNAECPITLVGSVRNLDTSAWPANTTLYLSADGSGNLTDTVPEYPNFRVKVATVTRSHASAGTINVDIGIDYGDGVVVNDFYARENVSVGKYLFAQPLSGSIGSGIINASSYSSNAGLNISTSGLNLTYPSIQVRVHTTANSETYCDIPGSTIVVPDDQHTVFYVNSNCELLNTTIQTFINTDFSPGGFADVFNVLAHDGSVDATYGNVMLGRRAIADRQRILLLDGLKIVSGLDVTTGTFPEFSQDAGKYIYVDRVVDTSAKNSTADGVELVYRTGGVWTDTIQTGINLTHCDNTTDLIPCSGPSNRYRRYLLFFTGYKDGRDTTKLHQRAADDSTYFTNVADCLDTETNPLSLDIADYYDYSAVRTYIYCAQPTESSWVSSQFLDLREGAIGFGAGIDTSIFLTLDGSRQLTADWNAGSFDITASQFFGSLNASDIINRVELNNGILLDWTNITGRPSVLSFFTDDVGYLTQANSTAYFVNRSDWTTIDNYPAACTGSDAVTGLGDTLTCNDAWVDVAGDVMSGALNMNGNQVQDVLNVTFDSGPTNGTIFTNSTCVIITAGSTRMEVCE